MDYNKIKETNLNNFETIEKTINDTIKESKETLIELTEFNKLMNNVIIYSKKDILEFIINDLKNILK